MKILIIKPSSLGDVIHALPFLHAIRSTFRDAHIEWVISKNLKGILEGNPLIDGLIVVDKDSWKNPFNLPRTIREFAGLIRSLRAERYDITVDLQGLLRSGLITFFSHSPIKIGFKSAREGSPLFYNKKILVNGDLHAVERCLTIAKSIGSEVKDIEFPLHVDSSCSAKIRQMLGETGDYAVIVPSARWETKRWPSEKFGQLITRLPFRCVISGSRADSPIVQKVLSSSGGRGIDLCGKTNLKELTALIAGARLIVGNDSGPLHIGVALGVPVIGLFGPTDPGKTGPFGWRNNGKVKVLRASAGCSPCFKKKCKDPFCMNEISVDAVLREIKVCL